MMRSYLTEFIGTFFLVVTVCLTVTVSQPLAAIAIGSALMFMVYMGGHISGGHYNPAVTLSVWLRGKLPGKEVIPYWIAQLLGGVIAGFVSTYELRHAFVVLPSPHASVLAILIAEFIFTFALCLVVLHTATSSKTAGNSYYGLAIGFTIMSGTAAVGSVSGAAFNPAIGVGPALAGLVWHQPFAQVWYYIVGPLIGGAVAAAVFKFQSPDAD